MSKVELLNPNLIESATFICGHPKSGTSLLAGLLDDHPQLLVYPEETGYFRRFLPAADGLTRDQLIELAAEEILRIFKWDPTRPHPSQVGYEDRDYRDLDYAAIRREFMDYVEILGGRIDSILPAAALAYGSVQGLSLGQAKRWVEKTPYNERFADQIFASWGNSVCLHIVRDPRDTYTSHSRKHPGWGPEAFTDSWRTSVRVGMANQETYGPDRYQMLRYEDLVADQKTTMKGIARFLGIDEQESIYIPSRRGIPWSGNSMYEEDFTEVSDSPVGRWESVLDRDSVERLEGPSMAEMKALGYIPKEGGSLKSTLRWVAYQIGLAKNDLVSRTGTAS